MFKMLVSDMDGTLLKKGEDILSDEIIEYINKLKKKGVIFAIASGRQYGELFYITNGMKDIYYICSDGGCIIYNGEVIYKKDIFLRNSFKSLENIIFHSYINSYYFKMNNDLRKEVENYRGNLTNVAEFNDIDNVVKISAFGGSFFENPFGTYEVYKDKKWREWIKNGSGKGQAVDFLKERCKVNTNEVAVIGDNFNDMGMMRCGKYRFSMNNAPNQVKMICGNITYKIEEVLRKLSEEDL